jgi:hypothetical protein
MPPSISASKPVMPVGTRDVTLFFMLWQRDGRLINVVGKEVDEITL